MPQPDLPAPLHRRPEPGPELLEAVSLRQAERCLRLSEQWVHRRGITDLLRFCRQELTASQGAAAASWLQELLNQDTAVAPAGSTPEGAPLPAASLPGSAPATVSPALPAPSAAETIGLSPEVPDRHQALTVSEDVSADRPLTLAPPEASPSAAAPSLGAILMVTAAEAHDPQPPAVTEAWSSAALTDAIPTAEPTSPGAIRAVPAVEIPSASADAALPAWPQQEAPRSDLAAAEPLTHEFHAGTESLHAPSHLDIGPTAWPTEQALGRDVSTAASLAVVETISAAADSADEAPAAARLQSAAASAFTAPEPLTPQSSFAATKELAEVLESRAEAAVDAAFAALEETFGPGLRNSDGSGSQPAAATTPAPSTPAPQPLALTPSPPAPIPPVGAAWPNLIRSALAMTAALQPSGVTQPGSTDASDSRVETGAHDTEPDQATAVATPRGVSPTDTDAIAAEAAGQPLAAPEPLAAEETDEASAPAPGPAELLERLRGRLSWQRLPRFTRLRAVMRDCVDETLALLRSPEEDGEEEQQVFQPSSQAPAHDPFALLDSATLTPSAPPSEPATSAPEMTPPAWTAVSQATPAAAETAASPSWASLAPTQPAAPRPAPEIDRTSRLRRGLLGRRGNAAADRPAPAPSTLSDLRVWLPERNDLPRAS